MITVRTRIPPAVDKVADARDFLTEWVRMAQSAGHNLALTQRIYSSEGPMLIVPRRFENIAEADANRRANLNDADWQARLTRVGTMLRSPTLQTLEETIVGVVPTASVSIVRRIFFAPAMGKIQDLRSLLTEFVQERHGKGHSAIGLAQQLYSETGPRLILTTVHADMSALDQSRQERAAEAQALITATAPLCAMPVAVRLLEVIVPFPN